MTNTSCGLLIQKRARVLLKALLKYDEQQDKTGFSELLKNCSESKTSKPGYYQGQRSAFNVNRVRSLSSQSKLTFNATLYSLAKLTAFVDNKQSGLTEKEVKDALLCLEKFKILEQGSNQGKTSRVLILEYTSEKQILDKFETACQKWNQEQGNFEKQARKQLQGTDKAEESNERTIQNVSESGLKPRVEPEFTEGRVALDSKFYVERPPNESTCYETLLQPGSLLRIKAPSMMGKTLLMTRVLAQLATQGYRTANVKFKDFDKTDFTALKQFLRLFCEHVSQELELLSRLDDYWNESSGSKTNCNKYFQRYLLSEADSPLVLCLDDVDLVFPYPEIYKEFFELLRSWHERGNSHPIWKRLRLVVVHSTEVYVKLDINSSPFNVGTLIELPEFTPKQVQGFAQQHGLDWDDAQVDKLMRMVGGHPYLVQQAIFHLKTHKDITLSQFLETAPTEAGIYRNHLWQNLEILQQHQELATGFKKLITATIPVQLESTVVNQLYRLGLVKWEGKEAKPRCDLYSQYFGKCLGDT